MHTSNGAAHCRGDDGAPELCARDSLRRLKVKEFPPQVNRRISRTARDESNWAALQFLIQRVDISVGAAYIHGVTRHRRRGKNGSDRHHFLYSGNHVVIEKVEESRFVVWGSVWFGIGRTVFPETLGFKAPSNFLRSQVNG